MLAGSAAAARTARARLEPAGFDRLVDSSGASVLGAAGRDVRHALVSSRRRTRLLPPCWSPRRSAAADDAVPKLLSWSEQMRVRESWLPKRYELLLRDDAPPQDRHVDRRQRGVPRRSADPVHRAAAAVCGRSRLLRVHRRRREGTAASVAITGFAEEQLRQFFESPVEPQPAQRCSSASSIAEHQPKRIGLDYRRGAAASRGA